MTAGGAYICGELVSRAHFLINGFWDNSAFTGGLNGATFP
jgi:hypothetical protein